MPTVYRVIQDVDVSVGTGEDLVSIVIAIDYSAPQYPSWYLITPCLKGKFCFTKHFPYKAPTSVRFGFLYFYCREY